MGAAHSLSQHPSHNSLQMSKDGFQICSCITPSPWRSSPFLFRSVLSGFINRQLIYIPLGQSRQALRVVEESKSVNAACKVLNCWDNRCTEPSDWSVIRPLSINMSWREDKSSPFLLHPPFCYRLRKAIVFLYLEVGTHLRCLNNLFIYVCSALNWFP